VKRFSLRVRFLSGFPADLQSDTLFGEFWWAYGFLKGFEKLEELIRRPSLVLSDPIPEGYLPFPKVPLNLSFKNPREYRQTKKLKKKRWIKASNFKEAVQNSASFEEFCENLTAGLKELEEEEKRRELLRIGITVDRTTGVPLEGALYHRRELFNPEPYRLYGLVDGDLTPEEVEEVFAFLGENGVGPKKSSGSGKFEVERAPWDLKESGKTWFLSLSTGLPEGNEVEELYAEFFTKFPKHGREVGVPQVFKEPLIQSKAGSVFKASKGTRGKAFYGSTLTISCLNGHRHSRLVLPLFFL